MNSIDWHRLRSAALGAITATAMVLAPAAAATAAPQGQILGLDGPNAIDDSYIVVFKDTAQIGVAALAGQLATKYGAKIEHTYQHALRGFAGTMSRADAKRLAGEQDVAYVEQNGTVQALDTQPGPPSWGLDRVDQRDLPLNNSYSYSTIASTVRVYIIDTGVRTTHTTFGGRVTWGTNTTGDGNDTDCNGHGTHVSGTVGGSEYGVAKGVQLTAVKVLDCAGSGSFAGVAAGIDWVTGNHPAGAPAVANMSLGGIGTNVTVETAVQNSIADGVVYALAAGNNNGDACNFTPARVPEALTVASSTITDARSSFSNRGSCVDLFAPGSNIVSSYNTGDTASATLSGTSMASPHVAGAAALILAANPGLSPAQVAASMLTSAAPNKITDPAGSPNLLLFTTPEPPPSGTPIALRALVNGLFVCAENGGASSLIANRGAIGLWESFDLIDTGDGNVALRSHANGRYVAAENAGASPLIANRDAIGLWERFQIIDNGDGSISLRAAVNGLLVAAESAGAAPLIANRTAIGPWERFERINL